MTEQPPILITAEPVHGSHARPKDMYITCWRETPEMGSVLDWEFNVSFSLQDAEMTVKNIVKWGVHHYFTYRLGEKIQELSSEY